jgi:hypothetical protein
VEEITFQQVVRKVLNAYLLNNLHNIVLRYCDCDLQAEISHSPSINETSISKMFCTQAGKLIIVTYHGLELSSEESERCPIESTTWIIEPSNSSDSSSALRARAIPWNYATNLKLEEIEEEKGMLVQDSLNRTLRFYTEKKLGLPAQSCWMCFKKDRQKQEICKNEKKDYHANVIRTEKVRNWT